MAWFSPRAFMYQGSEFVGGMIGGAARRLVTKFWFETADRRYTDTQVTTTVDQIKMISDCDPMDQDLKAESLKQICKALRNGNEDLARHSITKGATDVARPWCIDLLKICATSICTCGPRVIKEATFNLLDC